jgi:putative drug exporter of the RND superfamily
MTRLLHRIGHACGAHPWRTALAWIVLLGAVTAASALTGGTLRDTMDVPGTSSARATASLRAHFPAETGAEAHLVARWPSAVPDTALAGTAAALRELPNVRTVATTLSPDGRSAMLVVRYRRELADLEPKASTDALTQAATPLRRTGAEVAVGGQVPEGIQGPNGVAESIGIGVALVILVLAFGSVIAAGLPVLMAGIGIGVGTGLIGLLAAVVDVNTVSPTLGSMLGLGVGIDYALLIIARHRDGLAGGRTPLDAVAEAIGTAGHAVVFAGVCVLIGISGLAFSGIPSFASMGVAAGLVVLATLAAAVTLLPAVLVPLGDRVLSRRTRRGTRAPGSFRSAWAARATSAVVRRPAVALGIGLVALFALAAPALDMRLGQNDAGSEPVSNPTRQAYDLVADGFGAGANGPLTVVIDRSEVSETALATQLGSVPGMATVAPPLVSDDGTTAVLNVIPTTGPQDEATYDLVHRLHDTLPPGAELTGPTAGIVDMTTTLGDHLWLVIAAVLAATFVLLIGVFGSLVLAVKAVLANLLSVAASFGALTWAFQTSTGAALLGLAGPVPIAAWAPVVLFAILFGLSTDYEVFMLSRVKEAHTSGLEHRPSIIEGLASSAKVITCAAAIMIAVAAGFAADPSIMVKIIGVGMAVAILVDVTLVRLLVVPATLAILGRRTWYLPAPLHRLLPKPEIQSNPVAAQYSR